MTELVDPDKVEAIVGARRSRNHHIARAVSAEQRVYVLHSHACVKTTPDLRDCAYSAALDVGIDSSDWSPDREDLAVFVTIRATDGRLVPHDLPGWSP